jgi:hypothetical protein
MADAPQESESSPPFGLLATYDSDVAYALVVSALLHLCADLPH